MKCPVLSLICAGLLLSGVSVARADQSMQDVVYLKNGSIIRGTILEQIPEETLKIQTADGSVFVYNIDEVDRITKEPQILKTHTAGKKSPGLAFGLSFLIFPGAGQFYNGESAKGGAQLALAGTGVIILINGASNGSEVMTEMGLMLWLGSSVWSWIDAPISASRINAEHGHTQFQIPGRHLPTLSILPIDRRTGGVNSRIEMTWKF